MFLSKIILVTSSLTAGNKVYELCDKHEGSVNINLENSITLNVGYTNDVNQEVHDCRYEIISSVPTNIYFTRLNLEGSKFIASENSANICRNYDHLNIYLDEKLEKSAVCSIKQVHTMSNGKALTMQPGNFTVQLITDVHSDTQNFEQGDRGFTLIFEEIHDIKLTPAEARSEKLKNNTLIISLVIIVVVLASLAGIIFLRKKNAERQRDNFKDRVRKIDDNELNLTSEEIRHRIASRLHAEQFAGTESGEIISTERYERNDRYENLNEEQETLFDDYVREIPKAPSENNERFLSAYSPTEG